MQLNRAMQLEILRCLRDAYPEVIEVRTIPGSDDADFQGNLFYLTEHDLVASEAVRDFPEKEIFTAQITAKGLDFLEDDGGLGAILGKITVRFDADNIRSLLENKIIASNLPKEQKNTLVQKIRSFSDDMLKSVLLKLLDWGLDHPAPLKKLMELLT